MKGRKLEVVRMETSGREIKKKHTETYEIEDEGSVICRGACGVKPETGEVECKDDEKVESEGVRDV